MISTSVEASVEFRSHFFPRNRRHFTSINLANASLDLLRPGRFDVFIGLALNAFEKPPGQLSSLCLWELRCFSEQLRTSRAMG
jgi:hypothetical protein